MKISTLYESADEFYLDINIYAKNKSASARDYNELKEQFYKEFEEQKPLPTLQERRYQVSDLVSDDYKITNTEQLVLGSNERLLDLHTVSSVEKLPQLEGVVPLDVVKMFSYENTMNISDIESYLEGTVEGYKGNSDIIGTTSVRKDLQLTDSEISGLETGKNLSTEQDIESDEVSFTSDDEVVFTSDDEVGFSSDDEVAFDSDDEVDFDSDDEVDFDEFEFDTNKDTKVQFSIEKYPVISYFQISVYIEPYDVIDLDSDFSIEFSIEPYDVLNLGSESVTFSIEDYDVIDFNEGGTEDEDYDDDVDYDSDEDEEDYDDDDSNEDVDDSDEDEEDYDDEDYEDYDEEGYTDDSDEDEEDYDDDDSDEGIDDSDEEETDFDEDEGSLGSEVQKLEIEDSKESTDSTQNSEDNFFSGISYAEDKEEKPTVVDTKQEKQQNNTPTEDIISVEEKPTDIRKFLRSHPRSTIAEVCKYFSKEEINKAILTGKIVKRGNKLHI